MDLIHCVDLRVGLHEIASVQTSITEICYMQMMVFNAHIRLALFYQTGKPTEIFFSYFYICPLGKYVVLY